MATTGVEHQAQPVLSRSGSAWVEPIQPLVPRIIKCSAIENLCAHVYPTPSLFLPLQSGEEANVYTHFENMRQGLSRVLYEIPILAGTLQQDTRGAFSVEIPEAPHAGARFYFCDVSKDPKYPTFEQLAAAGFPLADGNLDGLEKLRPDPFPASEAGDPVIVTQFTHLRGGIIVYCAFSHLVGDLVLGREYPVQWATHTRLVTEAALRHQPTPPIPSQYPEALMDRSRLLPAVGGPLSVEEMKERGKGLPNFKPFDPMDMAGTMAELQNLMPKAHVSPNEMRSEEDLRRTTMGVWRFSLASLKAIRKSASESDSSGERITIMDAFIAFLWQRFFGAKYALPSPRDGDRPDKSTLVFAGDVRRRLNPPLPQAYLGAAVDIFRVEMSREDILPHRGRLDGLGPLATAIRRSNGQWSEQQYMTLLELAQRAPVSPGFVPKGPIDLLVTDHTRLSPILDADWGPGLGKTVAFREPYFGRTCPGGEMTLLARGQNGDIEVMVAGESITLERLSADADMSRMSTRVFTMHHVLEAARKSDCFHSRL
ncbi:hypothetical protein LTR85_003220 [Meristemomyces frigidus]|nr:hypothetical protein LTR85_003220 [Meristemomyces frigidus]